MSDTTEAPAKKRIANPFSFFEDEILKVIILPKLGATIRRIGNFSSMAELARAFNEDWKCEINSQKLSEWLAAGGIKLERRLSIQFDGNVARIPVPPRAGDVSHRPGDRPAPPAELTLPEGVGEDADLFDNR